jgi:hypothetical protein
MNPLWHWMSATDLMADSRLRYQGAPAIRRSRCHGRLAAIVTNFDDIIDVQ